MGGEKLLTLADLSAQLQVPISTLRKWIFKRVIPVVRLGSGRRSLIRFRPAEIQRWVESQERGTI